MRPYVNIAIEYAGQVLDGTIPSSKLLRLACQRFFDDIEKSGSLAHPYELSRSRANHVCQFVESMPFVKAMRGNPLIVLEPWQVFVCVNAFGWVCRFGSRKGHRRFSQVFLCVPRGNGKSTLSSALVLYMLAMDGEPGAEVYCTASTEPQARLVFDDAMSMAKHTKSTRLMKRLGVESSANALFVRSNNSKAVPLSGDGRAHDGLQISFCVVDELHAHANRLLWDAMVTGAGKRESSMIFCVTTAGLDLSGIGYEQYSYAKQVIEGGSEDDSLFALIYTIDPDDDWEDPLSWRKANPNWGVSVKASKFEQSFNAAKNVPSKRNAFLTKHLNVWQNDASSFFDVGLMQQAMDPTLDVADFRGKQCWIGLDLSSKSDMTARALVFPEMRGVGSRQELHLTVFVDYWLPAAAVKASPNASYLGWVVQGYLTETDGNTVDYTAIEDQLHSDLESYQVEKIGVDPWNANMLVGRLQADGAPVFQVSQNVSTMSEPSKELQAMVLGRRLHFNDPVLVWMASCTSARDLTNGNVKLVKSEAPGAKIDGIVAIITALAMVLSDYGDTQDRGVESYIVFV